MMRLSRIIFAVTLTAFLVNTVVIDFALAQLSGPARADKLAPSLRLADDGQNPQHATLVRMLATMQLALVAQFKDIDDQTEASAVVNACRAVKQITVDPDNKAGDSPLKIEAFFEQVEHIGEWVFFIPVTVRGRTVHNYNLLFSTKRRRDAQFSVWVLTNEELDRYRLLTARPRESPKASTDPVLAIEGRGKHVAQLDKEADFIEQFLNKAKAVFEEIFAGGDEAARARMRAVTKGDQSPVTVWDPEIERRFHDDRARVFPEDGVWGEELAGFRMLKPRMWTVDPIDGTIDFCDLGRHFGTLNAFYESGNIRIGAGYWPRLDLDGSGSTRILARADTDGVLFNGKRTLSADAAKMNQSDTVIIGCHPEAKTAMRDALKKYFEERGLKVVFSTASGGEVAEMMLRGTARLFIHLTPAVVDAPVNAFFANKLGLKASDRNGNSVFQMPFQYLQEGLFFDSLVIGTPGSHAMALEAFKVIGEPDEGLPWTEMERSLDPVKAIQHYNEQMRFGKGQLRSDPYLSKKKEIKKKELREQITSSIRHLTQAVRDATDALHQLLVQENTYRGAVLDPERGALKDVVDIYAEKSKTGKSTLVAEGGAPGSGKTRGGKNLAEEVARRTRTTVPVLKEDNFMWQRNRRVGPDGKPSTRLEDKFQWAKRDQVIRDLASGRSILKPMFDDMSGGNLLLSLDKNGNAVIHNGNITITIYYKNGDRFFSYDEIRTLTNKSPENLTETGEPKRNHINITDSGLFASGSTKVRIRIKEGRLVIGLQGMEVVAIEKGEAILADRLTDHVIDFISEDEAQATIQVPQGNEHLREEACFKLVKVLDPKKTEELLKAGEAKEFLAAGTPVVFEGQFAFLTLRDGSFVRDRSLYDVSINYRAPRMVRWSRDMIRSMERGKAREDTEVDVARFYDRAWSEEHLSVPSGAVRGIIQVNTTDLAQSALRLIYYGREGFPMYRRLFEQLGIDPSTIDEEQRKNIDEPMILKLLTSWAPATKQVRSVNGITEYRIGKFLVRTSSDGNTLSGAMVLQNKKLYERTNGIMAANSIVDLTSLGPIFDGKTLGVVSVWNDTGLLADRLRQLASAGDDNSIREGKKWVDAFIEQEKKLHGRGIVDSDPDIMKHRRLCPVHGEITVTVVSPEENLKMGKGALELYRSSYLPDSEGNNIYTRPDVIAQVPEPFRDYYLLRARESLNINATLRGFFKNEFEEALPTADRTDIHELPADLAAAAITGTDIVPKLNELRNWGVEHPAIFSARIDHMRLLYTRYFIELARRSYFPAVQKGVGTPQLAWAALFIDAYPDRYAHFYKLVELFYEELLSNPFLLDEKKFGDNDAVHKLILELYQRAYERIKVENPPPIEDCTWQSFDLFLNQARMLGASWEKSVSPKPFASGKNETKVTVRDEREYARLTDHLSKPRRAVVMDLDGTVTRTDPKTNRPLTEVKTIHDKIIGLLARLAKARVLVAGTTNRRKAKALEYAEEVLGHPNYGPADEQPVSPGTGGSYVEMYYGSGVGGVDAGHKKEFTDFEISFPQAQRNTIIEALLREGVLISRARSNVEDLENKINLYIVPGTDRQIYFKMVYNVLEKLGYVSISGETVAGAIPVRLVDAGEGVFTIIPTEANKARARNHITVRHGLTEDDLLVLVDQPQPGAGDEALAERGGITVGEENPNIEGLISTKKAIGLTGPEAALWCLEHANMVDMKEDPESVNGLFDKVGINAALLVRAINECGADKTVSGDKVADEKAGFVFSEKVTFGDVEDGEEAQGLGVLLPVLANAGIKVAVLLSSDPQEQERQGKIIDILNEKIALNRNERRIRYGVSIGEINRQFADLKDIRPVRFYYLKTNKEPGIEGVLDSINIMVKKILESLGRLCGIIQPGREPDKLYEAAKKFAQAA